jgi:hypothetical protein
MTLPEVALPDLEAGMNKHETERSETYIHNSLSFLP